MLTTKRYGYVLFDEVQIHPDIPNHRMLDERKVAHYERDIVDNGLLEPLVVWEKRAGELYLVGGFHRRAAIENIRQTRPGYFDRVDVRVVAGDMDEIRALNLKLNADRVDTKITDYFNVVIDLTNANWSKERIAEFLDRSVTWIAEIIRFAPILDGRVRALLDSGALSWGRAKNIARAVLDAPAGRERAVLDEQLRALDRGPSFKPARRPVTLGSAKKRLSLHAERFPAETYTISADDLMSLLLVLEGKRFETTHVDRVRSVFPQLMGS